MLKFTERILRYPKFVIGTVLVLTCFFAYELTKVKVSTELKDVLPQNDPKLEAFEEVDEIFGGVEFIMLALHTDDIFQYNNLKRIEELTEELENMRGVSKVTSITNIEEIRGIQEGIEVVQLIDKIPQDRKQLEKLRKKILTDTDYTGNIVSEDGRTAAIVVQILPNADQNQVVEDVRELVRRSGNKNLYLTGGPVIGSYLSKAVGRDMFRLFPIVILVVIIVLALSFRNLQGVILPLITVVIAVIWTIGLMGFSEIPLSQVSSIMPIILMSVGTAYGIHMLVRHREEINLGFTNKEAVTKATSEVGLAIFLASVTTVAGFASLCFSPLRIIKEFGLVTAFGVACALLLSTTFIPSILILLSKTKKRPQQMGDSGPLNGLLKRIADASANKPKLILGIAGLFFVLAVVGIPRIRPEMDLMGFFRPHSEPRQVYNFVKENLGGAETIEIMVEGDIQDPNLLESMERLQDYMGNIEILSNPFSIVNILEKTNRALHYGDLKYEILPSSREEIAQYLFLLSMGSSDILQNVLSFGYSKALIQARVGSITSLEKGQMVNEVEKAIKNCFGDETKVTLTGMPVLTMELARLLTRGQLQSFASAIVFVFILMILIFMSFTYGGFCTVPIVLTSVLNFGLIGWAKIPLDAASAMIASIAVGIGIDYSIHFFSRFREEKRRGKTIETNIFIATKTTGKAILYNAGAVGVGFLVLIFSSFPPLARFGWLVALTMLFSAGGAITVLPSLLALKSISREEVTKCSDKTK